MRMIQEKTLFSCLCGRDVVAVVAAPCALQGPSLVALYCTVRLRFGYGFGSRYANGPRNVENTNSAKQRPFLNPPLLTLGSQQPVLKVPKRGQSHAAIRATTKRFENEKSAQRASFWGGHPADIRGSFPRISQPKTSVRVVKIPEKTSISVRTSMTRIRGCPRPQGTSKNFGQKTFGLNFRSLALRFVCPSCARETDSVAAELLRCGIASEALRRNLPLSPNISAKTWLEERQNHIIFARRGRDTRTGPLAS